MLEENKTPEEMLKEALNEIKDMPWTDEVKHKYPVEYEPIGRYCKMVDDKNPLHTDLEFAKNTKFGNIVVPLFATSGILKEGGAEEIFSMLPKRPGEYAINLGQEYEFYKRMVVGDRISLCTRVADIEMKKTSIDPKAWFIKMEWLYKNQKGEKILLIRNLVMCHRSPEQISKDN